MDVSVPRKAMICLESLPVRYDMACVGLKFIKHLLGKDSCWSRVCAFEFVERPLADACITDTSFYYIQILIKPFRGPRTKSRTSLRPRRESDVHEGGARVFRGVSTARFAVSVPVPTPFPYHLFRGLRITSSPRAASLR